MSIYINCEDTFIVYPLYEISDITKHYTMKICLLVFTLLNAMIMTATAQVAGNVQSTEHKVYRLNAEEAKINSKSTEVIDDERLSNKKGVTLKAGITAAIDSERDEPDVVFDVKVPKSGRYVMSTFAVTDVEGAKLMKEAKGKYESLYIKIQIDSKRATKRVVYVPWDRPRQESGKFELREGEQQVKVWLPRGVRLEYIEFANYLPPSVPIEAQNYQPKIVPPTTRPRLWVNQESLPLVKARLEIGENLLAWEKVKKDALVPFVFKFDSAVEMSYDAKLESAAETKAFYYLMTGDKKIGRESITLMSGYLSNVEFGNILDVTREIGRAIFTASEVYDWCYDLLSTEEKKIFVNNLMRLADDMEIGWPPFLQKIVNGHGNEAQINRDLLSMSIAIYDENPLPYKYCSYSLLEELVPMRKFEYQSPRHNQGIGYGAYRFAWEMHAVWLLYSMNGHAVFDDNIKNVPKFWQYMRAPDGQMMRDGDGFSAGVPGKPFYWKGGAMATFLSYTYAADPILKSDFERQGGLPDNPVLFLLLNDPELKAESNMESLPLTIDFGPVLGSMVARTGWNIGINSNDVVAEIKGGGYHFGNHQHSDAGSIQLFYRGFQFGDIGLYKFYGTPYDLNFNKRSIAHSMMLAVAPSEKFLNTESNDGGTRLNQSFPKTPQEAQTNPIFDNGKVLSADFGPSKQKPLFSYFAVDLVGAYSPKISNYTRGFCFLNMNRKDVPAVIILTDDIVTTNPEFKKYWQINSLNLPEKTKNGVILNNQLNGLVGKTHIQMLVPAAADRQIEILNGDDANSSFKFNYDVPITNLPESTGHRIMVSPSKANSRDHFLTIFQVTDGDTKPLPVKHYETEVSYVVLLADRVVSMSNSASFIEKSFTLEIPTDGEYQVVLAGMQAGDWNVKSQKGKVKFNTSVSEGKNTIFFKAGKGKYVISPGRVDRLKELIVDERPMPGK